MGGYLIYHPRRAVSQIGEQTIYHDSFGGNQDPYVWQRRFLHTYCHMTQMSPSVGDINIWVSGNTFPDFTKLFCDLVFIVQEKVYWTNANHIARMDPMIESEHAYIDHYRWAMSQHPLKKRRRFTLKATPDTSFQPQDDSHHLINIVPILAQIGIPLAVVQQGLRAGFMAKPMRLDATIQSLYEQLAATATVKLYGVELEFLRQSHPLFGHV